MSDLSITSFEPLRDQGEFFLKFYDLEVGHGWINDQAGLHAGVYKCSVDPLDRAELERRVAFLRGVKNPHFSELHNFCVNQQDLLIVTPYCESSLLSEMLSREGAFSETQVIKILFQLIRALEDVHAQAFVHGRLLLENLAFDSQGNLKLLGFLHLYEGAGWGAQSFVAPVRYLPPEFFLLDQYDSRSDVYMLGVLLVEMLTGERWLSVVPDDQFIAYCAAKEYKIPLCVPLGTSDKLIAIINRCLLVNPDDRFQALEDMLTDLDEVIKPVRFMPECNLGTSSACSSTYYATDTASSSPVIAPSIGLSSIMPSSPGNTLGVLRYVVCFTVLVVVSMCLLRHFGLVKLPENWLCDWLRISEMD